jgi:hypothetical protein
MIRTLILAASVAATLLSGASVASAAPTGAGFSECSTAAAGKLDQTAKRLCKAGVPDVATYPATGEGPRFTLAPTMTLTASCDPGDELIAVSADVIRQDGTAASGTALTPDVDYTVGAPVLSADLSSGTFDVTNTSGIRATFTSGGTCKDNAPLHV